MLPHQSGCIQVSSSTYHLLGSSSSEELNTAAYPTVASPLNPSEWTTTGGMEIKGKGLMETWIWSPPETGFFDQPPPAVALKVSNLHQQ